MCFAEVLGRGRSHGKYRLGAHTLSRETPKSLDYERSLVSIQSEAFEEIQKEIGFVVTVITLGTTQRTDVVIYEKINLSGRLLQALGSRHNHRIV